MDADRACHLRQPRDRLLDLLARGHHQVGELVDDHDDIGQRLAKGETIYNYPARLRHKNGSVQNVLISSSVLFDDAGNFVHTRCFTVLAPASSGG